MAFIAQLTAGAMSNWETATTVVMLGLGSLACVTVGGHLSWRASPLSQPGDCDNAD